jgi:chemotaxis protein methyltransferase CheR
VAEGKPGPVPPARADFDIEMGLLIEAIYLKYHYDFRGYAPSSLKRRLAAALNRFECRSLSLLQDRVLRDPQLFAQLLDYLTVQVSDLFRDPGYFQALRGSVLPLLRTYPSIKIWVAGCSTGEEVYSLAILMHEEGLLDRTLIYATDINPGALRRAEAGVYEISRMAGFSTSYQSAGGRYSLSDYYTAAYSGARFKDFLRRNVLFFDHSLATDSVFAEVQLVSCRNVLIYFEPPLKDRAIALFREALPYKGFLGLGSRESLRFTRHADDFKPYVEGERIYQKVTA